MLTISSPTEITRISQEAHRAGKSVGLVPTMGALHQGHISLVQAARPQCDVVVVSVFVNPTQFGPTEDFATYPRNLDADSRLLDAEKTDCLFSPSLDDMYPSGASTWVTVEGLSEKLDGRSRPGHFRGVTTVVAKLFHIVQPDVAFFGQKDAAQAAVIRKMVRDLDFCVRVVLCPIVREPDGLAMSSRNAYLDSIQRQEATVLHRALLRVARLAHQGENRAVQLVAAGKQAIAEEPSVRLDYFAIVDQDTLDPVAETSRGALVAVAAYVGTTRLIDNILLPQRPRVT